MGETNFFNLHETCARGTSLLHWRKILSLRMVKTKDPVEKKSASWWCMTAKSSKVPTGKGSWRERRQALQEQFVQPHLLTCQQRKQQKVAEIRHAHECLDNYGLRKEVEPEVMMAMNDLLNNVERIDTFPDFVVKYPPPAPPTRNIKF